LIYKTHWLLVREITQKMASYSFEQIQELKCANSFCTEVILKKKESIVQFYYPSYLLFTLENNKYKNTIESEEWIKSNKYVIYLSDYEELEESKEFFIDYYEFNRTRKAKYLSIENDHKKLLFSTRFEVDSFDIYTLFREIKIEISPNNIHKKTILDNISFNNFINKPYATILIDKILLYLLEKVDYNSVGEYQKNITFPIYDVLDNYEKTLMPSTKNLIEKLTKKFLQQLGTRMYLDHFYSIKRLLIYKYFSDDDFTIDYDDNEKSELNEDVFRINMDETDNNLCKIYRYAGEEWKEYKSFTLNEYSKLVITEIDSKKHIVLL